MTILLKGQLRPKNASCSWSTACNFWRFGSAVCPSLININNGGSDTNILISVDGGWLSSKIGDFCSGTDSYVSYNSLGTAGDGFEIDIWKALADGVWSSSAVFNIYEHYVSGVNVGTTSGAIVVSPLSASSPSAQFTNPTINNRNPSNFCPTAHVGTLTINDDGTFTLV